MKESKKTPVRQEYNEHILNLITPSGIEVDKGHAGVGENTGQIFVITKYPEKMAYTWLAPLCQLEGTETAVYFEFSDSGRLLEIYDRRAKEFDDQAKNAKRESEKTSFEEALKNAKEMIRRLKINQEQAGYMNIFLHVQASNDKELKARIKRVSSVAAESGCAMKCMTFRQMQTLKALSPYGVPEDETLNMGRRPVPLSTVLGGYPMSNPNINDPEGHYIGKCSNKLAFLDIWRRHKDRTNSNWAIFGTPGTGKSSFVKNLFLMEYAFGTRILVIDPEKEYIDIAKHRYVNGDVINAAGEGGRINILEIRKVPEPEADEKQPEDEGYGINDLALHLQSIRVWFRLYVGELSSGKKAALEENLIALYKKFGITWETDINTLSPEDYPVLSDLVDLLKERYGDSTLTGRKQNILEELIDDLSSAAYGADSFLLNGHTNISSNAAMVVFDTSGLIDNDANIQRSQYYNLITWIWGQASRNRKEKVLIGVDEGYLCIDEEMPELARSLRNIAKRGRKYEVGLAFITHSLADILDGNLKRLSQPIIDAACYKMLLGCDGKNLQETVRLFKLTDKEEAILAGMSRGEGILMAGKTRLHIKIEISNQFLEIFGSAGGR